MAVNTNNVELCFTSESKCSIVVIRAILEAKKNIYVQAYGLTSASIAKALIEAHKRGVVVTGLFNFTNAADLRNVENLLVIKDKKLAKAYLDNWQVREWINELKGNH